MFPNLLPKQGVSQSLKQGECRGHAGSLLQVVCPLPSGCCCRDHEQYPAFASDTSEMTVEFWVFWYLVIDKLLHCACSQLVLVLYDFFVFCSSRRSKHLSRRKHCSRGSQVLACLKTTLKIRDRAETVLLHGVGMKEVIISERGGGQKKRPICIYIPSFLV